MPAIRFSVNSFFSVFRNRGFVFLLFSLLFVSFSAVGQSKKELEKRKAQLQKDIDQTNKLLKQTRRNKSASLNELVTLNRKIDYRKELISTINSEINSVDGQLSSVSGKIDSLTDRLTLLKRQYAVMLVNAYKHQGEVSTWTFVFASENINQAYKRVKYLRLLNEYRQRQRDQIALTQDSLSGKKKELQVAKTEKSDLLADQQSEKRQLDKEKRDQVKMLNSLSVAEKKLRADLRKKQRQEAQLSARIEEIIRREIELARAQSKKKSSSSTTASVSTTVPKTTEKSSTPYVLSNTPETIKLSNDFESNRGRLPWPVEQGVITGYYGRHSHPVWKDVVINNNGLNIASSKGAKARAVFEGKVTRVIMVVDKYAVLVQHGEYFTLYSNLQSVSVKAGDRVSTRQVIGTIKSGDDDNRSELHLEIWKGSNNMNPQSWLAAR